MSCTGDCVIRPRAGLHSVNPHHDRCCAEEDPAAVQRQYFGFDVRAAITDWGGYGGRSEAVRLAMKANDEMVAGFGPVTEVFHIDRYVAVRYEGVPSRIALYLQRENIDGTEPLKILPDRFYSYYRRPLVDRGPSAPASSSRSRAIVCACGMQAPLAHGGTCESCGRDLASG